MCRGRSTGRSRCPRPEPLPEAWSTIARVLSGEIAADARGAVLPQVHDLGRGYRCRRHAALLPGMLGSRKTAAELRAVYSGDEPVPVRSGRWWEVGSTPFEGDPDQVLPAALVRPNAIGRRRCRALRLSRRLGGLQSAAAPRSVTCVIPTPLKKPTIGIVRIRWPRRRSRTSRWSARSSRQPSAGW